jgi:hypothetical protein
MINASDECASGKALKEMYDDDGLSLQITHIFAFKVLLINMNELAFCMNIFKIRIRWKISFIEFGIIVSNFPFNSCLNFMWACFSFSCLFLFSLSNHNNVTSI